MNATFTRFCYSLLILITLMATNAFALGSGTPPNEGDSSDLTRITAQLDSLFSDWDSPITPGCAVAASEKGRTLISRAYGMADLENSIPNSPSTIFEAGSVSKQFLTAAIILLALDGKLSLEDDVRDHIPELPDYGETITIRHLMTHTSGLRDWGSVAAISGWGRGNRTHNHDHVLDILSRQSNLNFTPGERYSYSNSGYNLMAIIVDRVADQPFAEYSKEKIFQPLGMTSTQWRDDYRRVVRGRSSAYSGSPGDTLYTINRPIEHVHGNGGLLTTVADLLAWNNALASGYFGDEFYEEMHKQFELGSGRTNFYASGLMISSDHGQPQVVHTGATSGYRAYLSRFPEQELSVAILCNVTGANPGQLGSSASKIVLGDEALDEEEDAPDEITLTLEKLETFTGIWIDPKNYRPTEFILEDDTLRVKDGPVLTPVSARKFARGNSDLCYRFEKKDESYKPVITVIREGYEEEQLQPVNRYNAGETDLSDFTGAFTGKDAETTVQIVKENEKLVLKHRPSDTFELDPLYEDAFIAGGFGLIRFLKTESGDYNAFALSNGRVYDLRFVKLIGE